MVIPKCFIGNQLRSNLKCFRRESKTLPTRHSQVFYWESRTLPARHPERFHRESKTLPTSSFPNAFIGNLNSILGSCIRKNDDQIYLELTYSEDYLLEAQGLSVEKVVMYNASTLSLAQGVFLKNFKLDLTEGSFLKQLTFTRSASPSQP